MTSKIVNEFNTNEHKINAIKKKYSRNKKIGFFAFFALTSSMVMTVYEYASFASAGWGLILFLLIGGLCWFIPVAIMCAEMATVKGWEKGGLFTWIKWTLGPRWGFVAIFFQWFHITLGFITMLLFITTMLSFGFGGSQGLENIWGIHIYTTDAIYTTDPTTTHAFGSCIQNTTWATLGATFGVAILIFVIITLAQMFGVRRTTLISRTGFVIGIVIPFILLVIFGSIFISDNGLNGSLQTGFLPAISKSGNMTDAIVPLFQLVIFVSFILSYLGVEASASQINHLYKPKKNYPRVMVFLTCLAILFGSIAGIFIAITTKVGSQSGSLNLNFVAGIIQAFLVMTRDFMGAKTAVIVVRIISVLMGLAVVAQISSWLVGPSQAMVETSRRGLFPAILTKTNRFDVPIYMMLVQGCCVLAWALIIIFGFMGMQVSAGGSKGGDASDVGYLSAMKLTTLMYLVSYFLLIIGYFQFFRKSKVSKTVVIVKHTWTKYLIFVLALLVNAFAFIVAFFPQQNVAEYNTYGTYYGIMFGFYIPIFIIPHLIYEYYWRKNKTKILKDLHDEKEYQEKLLIEENKNINNIVTNGE